MLTKRDLVSESFFDNVNANCLTQHVLEPTLGKNQLDLILTNDPASIYNVSIKAPLGCTSKNSLHASLHWQLLISPQTANISVKGHNFKQADYISINNYFSTIDWANILVHKSINDNYQIIRAHYEIACLKFIPMKSSPILMRVKIKWTNLDVKSRTSESIVAKSKMNPKLLNSYINQNKKCKESIRVLRSPSGDLRTDKIEIVNLLNEQFFSAFSIPEAPVDDQSSTPTTHENYGSFELNRQIFCANVVDKMFLKLEKRKPAEP